MTQNNPKYFFRWQCKTCNHTGWVTVRNGFFKRLFTRIADYQVDCEVCHGTGLRRTYGDSKVECIYNGITDSYGPGAYAYMDYTVPDFMEHFKISKLTGEEATELIMMLAYGPETGAYRHSELFHSDGRIRT